MCDIKRISEMPDLDGWNRAMRDAAELVRDLERATMTCPACEGTGHTGQRPSSSTVCDVCGGEGKAGAKS